ncbi:MAG: ferrous iron transport protein A [Ignavibacteria bacterium]|nr:ferrous iron transport protein A [Ignavibacteria bacterium]
MTRLTEFEPGVEIKIKKINAGRRAVMNLMNMGILTGNTIKILRTSKLRGPVLINNNDTEIALGHGLARKIYGEII